jgi:site-specific recombinase XerC
MRDYAFIKLMIGCALSEIEIVRADVGDLRSDDGCPGLVVQGKGCIAKDARVDLPADVVECIAIYLAVRGDVAPSDPLFTSAGNRTRGMRMTTRGVRDRVNSYLESTGIKQGRLRKITPYSLRHTAAAIMAEHGATADEIRRRLRLGSLATAMLYLHHKEDGPDRAQ